MGYRQFDATTLTDEIHIALSEHVEFCWGNKIVSALIDAAPKACFHLKT